MKDFLVFLFFTFLLLNFNACVIDPCINKICQNGGFCDDDGSCVCVNGYSGSNCEIPPQDPCVINNTATFCMRNNSISYSTYDIILDGIRIMTLSPGQQDCVTVTAGFHNLRINFTNTNTRACNDSSPSMAQCSVTSLVCNI